MAAVKGETKELKVRLAKNTCLYELYYDNGGEVPAILKGLYTSEHVAKLAAGSYKAK